MRLPFGSKAMRASSPPIENGRPIRRPLATCQTDTWPQNVPAASNPPSGENDCERQPAVQSVVPSARGFPVTVLTSTIAGLDSVGDGDAAPGPVRYLPMAMRRPSRLNTGSPPKGAGDGGNVRTARRWPRSKIVIGASPLFGAGIRPASFPSPLPKTAPTLSVRDSTNGTPTGRPASVVLRTARPPDGPPSRTVSNPPVTASIGPTGKGATVGGDANVCNSGPPARQMRVVPSADAVATSRPTGLKQRLVTAAVCPRYETIG